MDGFEDIANPGYAAGPDPGELLPDPLLTTPPVESEQHEVVAVHDLAFVRRTELALEFV
jgi:hypothetical protein